MAVQQQQINSLGWPIQLQPAACTSLAFTGQGKADAKPVQTTAGETFSVLVETHDSLGQRISQVCDGICRTNACWVNAEDRKSVSGCVCRDGKRGNCMCVRVSAYVCDCVCVCLRLRLCLHGIGLSAPQQTDVLHSHLFCLRSPASASLVITVAIDACLHKSCLDEITSHALPSTLLPSTLLYLSCGPNHSCGPNQTFYISALHLVMNLCCRREPA